MLRMGLRFGLGPLHLVNESGRLLGWTGALKYEYWDGVDLVVFEAGEACFY